MIKKTRILTMLLVSILTFIMITGCSNKQKSISKTDLVLGTVVTINIYDHGSEKVVNKVFDKLKEIESKMTINGENSEVIGINDNAGKDFVKVSDETFYVIQKGKYFSELSKGRFDISIGTIVKLWNIGTEDARVPSQEEINTKKQLVNYHDVILNEEEQSVMLKQKGMILDLGGIAKGYAADAVAEILKENKVKHAIVNLGGNVFAYGNKLDGTPWKIGIQNPFSPREDRGKYIGVVNAANQTVVTSGVYERFLEKDGKYYHHILDPATGYPVENNLVGVSIIADRSIDADSLSTSAFSLGLEEGRKLIEAVDNVEAVFITKDQDVYITSGLKNNFQLTDTNFKLK